MCLRLGSQCLDFCVTCSTAYAWPCGILQGDKVTSPREDGHHLIACMEWLENGGAVTLTTIKAHIECRRMMHELSLVQSGKTFTATTIVPAVLANHSVFWDRATLRGTRGRHHNAKTW